MSLESLRKYLLEMEAYYSCEEDEQLKKFCAHLVNKIDEPDSPKLTAVK